MTLLVIGSVVGYSVILPKKAPKQITLGVLPFTEDGETTKLSLGFTAALRDSLALSRDVVVVDTISTASVVWEEKSSSELVSMLALTHVVEGEILSTAQDRPSITYRVLNVSHPTWKEVIASEGMVAGDSPRPWQGVRDELTISIRHSLYDNNSMRTESLEHDEKLYFEHLYSVGELLQELQDSPRVELWVDRLQEKYEQSITGMKTAPDVHRMSEDVVDQFNADGDLERYGVALWDLTDEYPNSSALSGLAELSFEFGFFDSAEQLWLRVARLKPQSAYVALRIADVRWRKGDMASVPQALRIAKIRSNDSEIVDYFERVYESLSSSESEVTNVPAGPSLRTAIRKLGDSTLNMDVAIHLAANRARATSDFDNSRLWFQPPIFMTERDNRWVDFQEVEDRVSIVPPKNLEAESIIHQLSNRDAITHLFTPRRPDS